MKAYHVVAIIAMLIVVTWVNLEVEQWRVNRTVNEIGPSFVAVEVALKEVEEDVSDLKNAGAVRNERLDEIQRDLNQLIKLLDEQAK